MSSPTDQRPLRVVVAGGGIAALETVLALTDLAPDRLEVTLMAPGETFSLRPLEVAQPFGRGHATALALADLAADRSVTLVQDLLLRVDAERRVVSGARHEVVYDELVIALGAVARPAFPKVLTFGGGGDPLDLNGLLADLEEGYSHSVAFVVPTGATWPLPIYELALMAAEQVWGMGMDVAVHLVTPEPAPLAVFGDAVAASLTTLLTDARIRVHAGAVPEITGDGTVHLGDGTQLPVDRIVALPALHGPALAGLPSDAEGFLPVDELCRVRGVEHVRGAGDATDQPIKQGGIACQQADVVAAGIAAAAGVAIDVEPLRPVLRGRLLTGRRDQYLRRDGDEHGEVAQQPLWWPPAKVHSRYLAPYLEARGLTRLPLHGPAPDAAVEVSTPLAVGT